VIVCNPLFHCSVLFLQLQICLLCAITFYLLTYLLTYLKEVHSMSDHHQLTTLLWGLQRKVSLTKAIYFSISSGHRSPVLSHIYTAGWDTMLDNHHILQCTRDLTADALLFHICTFSWKKLQFSVSFFSNRIKLTFPFQFLVQNANAFSAGVQI